MRSTWYQFSVLTIAMATVIALAAPAESFAQRGGGGGHGGGRGGGGHGGGHGGGGGHGVGRGGGGGGGPSHAGPRGGGGGGRGNSGPSWSGGNRGGGNWNSGPSGRQQYYGNLGNPGGGSRNYYRGGPPSLNQLYRGYYSSGYRGNVYGYGRPGFGPSYGRYGYGYFPWYVGLAAYGLNANRGYGSTNGYVASSAPVIVEQSGQPTSQPAQPADDYVPQLNRTTTVLGAQPSGAAVLGVTMDPQYAEAAVVRTVTPGSAAEKAGLRPGDMITTINGAEIRSPADVTNFVASQEAGAQVEMEFIRPILRSEVKEAAPEQGLGVTAPQPAAAPTLAEPAGETIPPPVPQPAAN